MSDSKQVKVVYDSQQGIYKHFMAVPESITTDDIRKKAYDEITSDRNENVTILDIKEVEDVTHESMVL